MEKKVLTITKPFEIRFSEVDSMGVVWHGHYAIYFEDAREAFGAKYNLEYLMMYGLGFFEPIVELTFKYKRPLIYGMKPEITITYCPCDTAKIIFDYEIRDTVTGEIVATGHSVQVFMDAKSHQLVLTSPGFYEEWKQRWGVNR
jgi:acyl-CoA thioester hydrolase